MATTYNTAFGSLPGYNEMLGTTNTTGGGQQQTYGQATQQQRQQQQPAQTFAQMQRQGMARPAPPTTPQAQPFAQYGGSQQAQQMRQRLQQQLETFGQTPSRFDTQTFQQIRGAQQANLQQEFAEQQRQLNEELARRGLSASTIGAAGMGRLAGAQSRALADIDAQLLQRAAETQAQDRAQLLAEGRGLAELASAQDLQQFEANRVAQAAEFEQQLRGAELGQRQFEFGGQQAFQAAQAEEAAQQAARQFELQTTGQAAELSMNLQRLLGQQELERAGLTGRLGGEQTLAAQQQAEQRRQFDIRQALEQQLGVGGLEVQRGQLGVEQQRLQQQGEQFRSQLDEQQAARMQQAGFTSTELAIKRSQVDNELSLQNRQLSETERNNLAIRELERDKFESDADFRSEQLGLNRDELNQRATQIKEDQRLRGVEIDNEKAYREAEIEARTTQIQNEFARSGQQIDVDRARIQAQRDIASADNTAQMDRLERQLSSQERISTADRNIQQAQLAFQNAARLSEQSGVQYTVNADGQVVPLRDAQGNAIRTSDFTQAEEARRQQETLTKLDVNLRRQLGLTEATGQMYNIDPTTGVATLASGAPRTVARERLGLEEAGVTGLFGGKLTQEALQNAYARAAQLSQVTGQQYTVNEMTGAITTAPGAPGTLAARLQEAGITGTFGGSLTQDALQNAYARAAQLSQVTGLQHTVDPRTGAITAGGTTEQAQLQRAELTGTLGGSSTLAKLAQAEQQRQANIQQAQFLTQQTGRVWGIDEKQNNVPVLLAGEGIDRTLSALDLNLRRAMGMAETTGYVYDPLTGTIQNQQSPTRTVQGAIAQNQMFMQLANVLSGLNEEQMRRLRAGEYAPPGTPVNGQLSDDGLWRFNATQRRWVPNTTSQP